MLPCLKGESNESHPEDFVVGWELCGRCAWRTGPWNITIIEPPFGSGTFELCNLEIDPTESYNLAEIHPETLQELMIHWENYLVENGVIIAKN
jgi:arylsulfatase